MVIYVYTEQHTTYETKGENIMKKAKYNKVPIGYERNYKKEFVNNLQVFFIGASIPLFIMIMFLIIE